MDSGFGVVTEVDEQPQAVTSSFQVIKDLSAVFIGDVINRFELEDDLFVTDEVCFVGLAQPFGFVGYDEVYLALEWNILQAKFTLKAFLVYCLQEARTYFTIYCEYRSLNCVTFIFIKNFLDWLGG